MIARPYFIVLGILSIAWAISVFPGARDETRLDRLAKDITAGQIFKESDLLGRMPLVEAAERDGFCHPVLLQSAAVIRLRLIEEAEKAPARADLEPALGKLVSGIRESLKCAPSDPFLWFVLYWAESTRTGSRSDPIEYLRLSYELGANEGWIALKRSPIVLAAFDRLPPDIAARAVTEFSGLVNSWYFGEAAEILGGPGWPLRDKLVNSLAGLPLAKRIDFQNHLRSAGYRVEIPGVPQAEARPWH